MLHAHETERQRAGGSLRLGSAASAARRGLAPISPSVNRATSQKGLMEEVAGNERYADAASSKSVKTETIDGEREFCCSRIWRARTIGDGFTDGRQVTLPYRFLGSFSRSQIGHPEIVVIDARSREAYAEGHIPSAVSFPHREMTIESTERLDRRKVYVVYCDGIGCNASTKGAYKLFALGVPGQRAARRARLVAT